MRKIQMVDLKGQYHKIKEVINSSFEEVLNSSAYINGPYVKSFQEDLEKYLNVAHVIPCANGTDALQIALMGLGLKQGDEIITTNFTFAATVEVIALLKLTPVLVDVNPKTFNIDVDAIKKAVTPKTKAIIPVHLFGQVADMEAILKIAKEHNLFVIEDNAQAIGANYTFSDGKKQKAGTIADIGTTSFFPSKNLGCYGDGGAIFTNNDKLAHTIRGIANHGMYKRYYHDVIGVNSRLDSIQAAVLKAKLPLLDSYCNARRKAAKFYNKALSGNPNIITPHIDKEEDSHVFHQYTLQITNGKRDDLHRYLLKNDIPNAIYYPVPLHKQKAYKNKCRYKGSFKVTNKLSKTVISLPIHTELDEEQLNFIVKKVNNFL